MLCIRYYIYNFSRLLLQLSVTNVWLKWEVPSSTFHLLIKQTNASLKHYSDQKNSIWKPFYLASLHYMDFLWERILIVFCSFMHSIVGGIYAQNSASFRNIIWNAGDQNDLEARLTGEVKKRHESLICIFKNNGYNHAWFMNKDAHTYVLNLSVQVEGELLSV